MILFPKLTIYSIVKKYVTINNKENTASALPSIIFLQTQSHFIAFDFTMKLLPIIAFYFRWRMLVDILTFELFILAPLKGKNWNLRFPKKRAIRKTSINYVANVTFQIVYNALKLVKTKIQKEKLRFLLHIPPLYFNTMISQQS